MGRPQRALVHAFEAGFVRGSVLDVGCRTGENALFLAHAGHEVTGVDLVERAIEQAREKAEERGVEARFCVLDALELERLNRTFDTAIDSGLFHVFDDADRARYVEKLGRVLEPGGRLVILCFSDLEPGDWGPRRVSETELRTGFAGGSWSIEAIEPARFEIRDAPGYAHAWLAVVSRRAPV